MMKVSAILLSFLLLLAGGCGLPERRAPFLPEEFAPYARKGTGVIQGRAWLWKGDDQIQVAAGREVILKPVTTYTTEWIERSVKGGITLGPPDPRARAFVRKVRADREGRFRFEGLPPGSYYLACPMNLLTFDCILGIDMKKVKWIWKKVDLGPGEVKTVFLTNDPEGAGRFQRPPSAGSGPSRSSR